MAVAISPPPPLSVNAGVGSNLLRLLGSLTLAFALVAQPTSAAPRKVTAIAAAKATMLQVMSATVVQNLSAGAVKTLAVGYDDSRERGGGIVVVPATYPLRLSPGPAYENAAPLSGTRAVAPSAARIDVTGAPGAAFSLIFRSWVQVSGYPVVVVSAANNTYYSPNGSPTTKAAGIFNAQGKATIYVGGFIRLGFDKVGSVASLKPIFTISYN